MLSIVAVLPLGRGVIINQLLAMHSPTIEKEAVLILSSRGGSFLMYLLTSIPLFGVFSTIRDQSLLIFLRKTVILPIQIIIVLPVNEIRISGDTALKRLIVYVWSWTILGLVDVLVVRLLIPVVS